MFEHIVVVVISNQAISNQDDPRSNPIGSQFSIPIFQNFCSESAGGIKTWDPVENSDTGGPSTITIRPLVINHSFIIPAHIAIFS